MNQHRLVLVRVGPHAWTGAGRIAGWTDTDAAAGGLETARTAARALRRAGFDLDVVFTSVLRRSIKPAQAMLEELDRLWLPLHPRWRLNGRHGGDFQGLDRRTAAARFGDGAVEAWRAAWEIRPPPLDPEEPRAALASRCYDGLAAFNRPRGESLADVVARVAILWNQDIAPELRLGGRVLILAHADTLCAAIRRIEGFGDEVPPWRIVLRPDQPLIYDLDSDLRPTRRSFLADGQAPAPADWKLAA